jgi:predicted Zn-dependent protease
MRQRRGLFVFVVGIALALTSCQRVGQPGDTVREPQQVQQQVSEQAGTHKEHLSLSPAVPASAEQWVPKEIPQADLYFVAIGDVPPAWLSELTAHFEEKFGMRITVLLPLSFDPVTFDPVRSQTVADHLISAVRQRYATLARDDRARVIGVTPYDMYMQAMGNRWQYTFSLRNIDDHFAIVSYARMDPAWLRERPDAERLRTRLQKMIAKNIGIMYYGLPISQNPRSVLYGQIGGVEELDLMTEYFEPE